MTTSESVFLYRIEHKETNVGPFQTTDAFLQKMAAFLSLPFNLKTYPSPWDDGIVLSSVPWFWVFGSPDLSTLMKWVSVGANYEENAQIYAHLQELGFVIRKFLVEEGDYRVSRSGMQVIFNAHTSRELELYEEMDFSDYITAHGVRVCSFGQFVFSEFTPKDLDYA